MRLATSRSADQATVPERLISVINLALQFLWDVKFIMVNRLNYWYAIVNCTVYSVFIIIIIIITIIIIIIIIII